MNVINGVWAPKDPLERLRACTTIFVPQVSFVREIIFCCELGHLPFQTIFRAQTQLITFTMYINYLKNYLKLGLKVELTVANSELSTWRQWAGTQCDVATRTDHVPVEWMAQVVSGSWLLTPQTKNQNSRIPQANENGCNVTCVTETWYSHVQFC
jgi:hypothetical protein